MVDRGVTVGRDEGDPVSVLGSVATSSCLRPPLRQSITLTASSHPYQYAV